MTVCGCTVYEAVTLPPHHHQSHYHHSPHNNTSHIPPHPSILRPTQQPIKPPTKRNKPGINRINKITLISLRQLHKRPDKNFFIQPIESPTALPKLSYCSLRYRITPSRITT